MRKRNVPIAVALLLASLFSATMAKPKATLLISRPVEASAMGAVANAWFSALTESYYHLRFLPLEDIEVVPVDKVRAKVPGFDNYGRSVDQGTLLSAARALGATHYMTHTYEVSAADGTVYYYAEVYAAKDDKLALTYEQNFPLAQLGKSLDEAVEKLIKTVKVTVPSKLSKVMKVPLLSSDPKSLQMLGAALFESQELEPARAAQAFLKVTQRDTKMALAYYEAAQRFSKVPDHTQTAKMLDNLIVQHNFSNPALYAQLSAAYRNNKSYERALHIVSRAEKEGWQTLELALEKAQILELTGNVSKAIQAYGQVLKIDPNQPDALLLMCRRNRADKQYSSAMQKADRLIKLGKHTGDAQKEKGLSLAALKKYSAAQTVLLKAAKALPKDAEINVALGDIYARTKKYLQAAQYYEKALKGMPNNLDVLLNVSQNFQKAKRPQDALAVLQQNQKHFYTSKEVTREIGLLEFEMKDTTNAQKHLEASVALKPADPRVFVYLGDIYAARKQGAKAIEMYTKAEPITSDKLKVHAALAKLYLAEKKPDKAQIYLQKVLATKASYPEANLMMASVLFEKKSYKSALKYYLNERKFHGNSPEVQKGVALCYYHMQNLANAELGLKKLVKLDPRNAQAFYYLAEVSLKLGKLDQVRTYISQADVLGRKAPELYVELAKKYAAKKQYTKAADAYRANLKDVPKNESAWVGLGDVLVKAKQDTAASSAYYQAYKLNPQKNGKLLAEAGHILHKAGKLSSSRKYYNEFLSKGYKDPSVNVNLARMAYREKKYPDVISLLSGVTGEEANTPEVLRMMAESYVATKKNAEALTYARKLVAKSPRDKDAIELAAQSFERAGDLKNAASMYQKYLAIPKVPKRQEYSYHLAELLVKAKQNSAAVAQLKTNMAKYPTDFRNHELLGAQLLKLSQYTNAVKLLTRPAAKPTAPPGLSKVLAEAHLKLGKKAEAATSYERYLAKEQTDSTAWYRLGSIYYDAKNYPKASRALNQASVLMPKNPDVLYKLGMSLYRTKKLREASDALSKVLPSKSKDKVLLSALAECYRSMKDSTNLVMVLQKQLSADPGNFDVSNELGNLLMAKGDLQSAITTLEQASRAKPSDVGLHMQLASLYARKKDPKNQLLHINAALTYAPKNADVTFEKARYHMLNNEPSEAKTFLEKTIKLDPKHVRALALYGSMLKGERKYRQAFDNFSKAVKLAPKNVDYMLQMAQCAHYTGKNDLAVKVITSALKLEPQNPKLMQWAGVFYLKDNKEEKAELMLKRALELDRSCAICDEYLGAILLSKGNFVAAVNHLESALKRSNGRDDNVMVKLARALWMSGDADKAVSLCNKALALNAANDEALYVLCAVHIENGRVSDAESVLRRNTGARTSGWIYLAQGLIAESKNDISSAMSKYKLASRVLPNNSDMQMGLGRVYLARKKWSDAIQAFGMASALEPSNPKIFVGMGKAYLGMKNIESAKEFFAEAARLQPAEVEAHYMMAVVSAKNGDHIEAIKASKTGLRYAANSAKLYYMLGEQYAMVKQYEDALKAFDDAADNDPRYQARAFKAMGDIYYRYLKDMRNAEKFYEKHISVGGKDPGAKTALKRMRQ